MKTAISTLLFAILGCDVRRNPEVCLKQEDCPDGATCDLDTNRCETIPDAFAGACSSNDQCSTSKPVCDMMMCRGCQRDDECASGVCELGTTCVPEDRILYVAPNGIAAGACPKSSPCNLGYARTQLSSAKLAIRLADGSYTLPSDFTLSGGSTFATVVGSALAVIDRSTPGPSLQVTAGASLSLRGVFVRRGIRCSDAKLDIGHLTMDAATETRPWLEVAGCTLEVASSELLNSPAEGILASGGSVATPSLNVVDTTIKGSAGHGLRLAIGGGNARISTSTITNGMQMGILADNTRLTVSRTTISENRRGGASLMGSADTTSYDITNNFIYRNGNSGDAQFGGLRLAPMGPSVAGNKIRHNTIVRNDSQVDASPLYAGGLYCNHGTAANNLISNNFAGNTTQPNAQFGGNCDIAGSLISGTTDFLFVSEIAPPFDHHIGNTNSPAMGAAAPSDVVIDFDGQPRPNEGPDVGADEYYP